MHSHLLTLLIFMPILAVPLILLLPRKSHGAIRITAAVFTGIQLALAIYLCAIFTDTGDFQFKEKYNWIETFNIQYYLGIDGISILMVLLTPLICFLAVFASWGINKGVKGYFSLMLLLNTGMMGVFCALDFFLFYVFWEITLLPMYFLIGVWGGPRKEYAAIKFFLYTLVGSVLMLLVMLAFYFKSDPHTFDLTELANQYKNFTSFGIIAFIGLYIAFAVKVPAFPFHTWLPDAHTEAPTAISVILAGILLKMGVYGILRICLPILPEATRSLAIYLVIIGVINIIYGALCTMAQKDMKRLIAYSSISHMGFCLLGIGVAVSGVAVVKDAVIGLNGAVLQMFNHGCISGMLFLLAGVIYDRAHHRDIDGFGGLASRMPLYTAMMTLAIFASMGLPGLSGFVGEFLVFLGAFKVNMPATVIAVFGVVLTAGYFLWMFRRMFLGPLNPKYANLTEINGREMFTLVPLGLIVIFVGIYPMPVINMVNNSLVRLLELVAR
ncbi:MAG: NADH-quinone oxidoreductase subunit M [Planctomycetes bacterium]|nr:NADH-quinone oxidoreductase subunit M [Planctomycetota bacterium]